MLDLSPARLRQECANAGETAKPDEAPAGLTDYRRELDRLASRKNSATPAERFGMFLDAAGIVSWLRSQRWGRYNPDAERLAGQADDLTRQVWWTFGQEVIGVLNPTWYTASDDAP